MTITQIAPTELASNNRTEASLASVTSTMPRIGLRELNELAGLQTRVDTKYMLTPEQMVAVLYRIGARLRVLEIDDQRSFGYESVYFDTRALKTFRDHRQGRRLRFKVRTRLYVDSGDCMLEVKVKNRRGATVKKRMKYPAHERFRLNAQGRKFVNDVLETECGQSAPELVAALVGTYSRTTFVDPAEHTRATLDTGLKWGHCADGRNHVTAHGPDMVLVETKSETGNSAIDIALRGLGIRPVKISKYAVGTALLHPHLAANPWNRLLRDEFGWQREPVPMPA